MKKQIDKYTKELMMPVVEAVCEHLQVNPVEVLKPGRKTINVLARHLSAYILMKNTKFGLANVGGLFGQSHCNIHDAVRKIDGFLDSRDYIVMHSYNACTKKLRSLLINVETQRKELKDLNFINHSATTFI